MTKDVEFPPKQRKKMHPPMPLGDLGDARQPLLAWAGQREAGVSVQPHAHPRAQLALCFDGVMRLEVGDDTWFIPDRHGIWIPSGLRHQLTVGSAIELQNFYLHPRYAARSGLPDRPTVVRATPLLRGIARRLAPGAGERLSPAQRRRLGWVALDEMTQLERPDLRLPGGRDPRLVAVMDHLLAHPEDAQGLARLAELAGSSERTLSRLFPAETGLSWRDWRDRMRFMLALEGLQMGQGSTVLAARLGYSSPSAFVAAFRRHFGMTPSEWRKRN
ncbi:AraC family transcriptional regulator [Thalassovita mangrovi]|uniref:Helix-turn-helix domain-containing protein n=1 Tax=Thalassovita mangrovi TaxID=2692236 RepID=A0A6L8LIX3_9RHOB|nr:helix-turn-helix transcriptional regulator [Thalassovita mangrovi]MYM54410.1 helix-turn-helix domain-containing protein [Thalassovita mangrovi]